MAYASTFHEFVYELDQNENKEVCVAMCDAMIAVAKQLHRNFMPGQVRQRHSGVEAIHPQRKNGERLLKCGVGSVYGD